MIDSIPQSFVRLTALLFVAVICVALLKRREPTWSVVIIRAAFLGSVLLMLTSLLAPEWRLPVLKALPPARAISAPITMESYVDVSESVVVSESELAPQIASDLQVAQPFSLSVLLVIIWAIGVMGLCLRQVIAIALSSTRFQATNPVPCSVQNLWDSICEDFDLRPSRVIILPGNRSPHLTIQGEVVLPSSLVENEQSVSLLSHALRHEAAHLRARDHQWFPVITFLKHLLWFHPLTWWLAAHHLQACEDARDAAAARISSVNAYRSSIAKLALQLLPVQGGAPGFFRKGGSLTRRLTVVKRSATQNPARTGSLAVAYGALFALAISLGGIVLVPQISAADIAKNAKEKSVTAREEKLKSIIIPRVEFENMPLKEALAYLQERSVELDTNESDPSKKGFNIILDTGGSSNDNAKLTLKLANVSLATALKYTVSLAQLKYKVEADAIRITPLPTANTNLYTKVFQIREFSPLSPGGGTNPFTRENVKSVLSEAGVTFAPGASAVYNAGKHQLIVRNTLAEMDLIEEFIRVGKTPQQLIEFKLRTMIVPMARFKDTPLKEALAFLEELSVELDVNERSTGRKGVNFVFKPGAREAEVNDTLITLKLTNVPLETALKYTLALAQLKYQVGSNSVWISPLNGKGLTTRKTAKNVINTLVKEDKPAQRKLEKSFSTTLGVYDASGKKREDLEFISRRQQNYILEFVAMPDSERFQIILHPSNNYKRATFIMRQGEVSTDKMFRIDSYQNKRAVSKLGIQVDVSELSITYIPDGRTFKLVRRVKEIIPTYYGQLKSVDNQGGDDFYVKKGDSFSLPSKPDAEYTLIEVTNEKAVISDKSE